MNASDKTSVDYPFLITLCGVGLLVALASLLLGVALGSFGISVYLAAACLLVTALVVGRFMKVGRAPGPAAAEKISVTRVSQPQVVTTREGKMVYCNAPYRSLMAEEMGRKVGSPLDLMEAAQAGRVKELLACLETGATETCFVPLLAGDGESKYAEVGFTRKAHQAEYVSWVFLNVTSKAPRNVVANNDSRFNLDQAGALLDYTDCGLMAVAADGQVIYINSILAHWLGGTAGEEVTPPFALSAITAVDPAQLSGRLQIRTVTGEAIFLEFQAAGRGAGETGQGDLEQAGIRLYLVFSRPGADERQNLNPADVNIDRFFRESPIGIAIVTEQGDVLERNHIFREYVEKLKIKDTRNLTHIIDPEEYSEFYDSIAVTLSSGQANSISDVGFKGKGEKHGHFYITRLGNFANHERVAILYLIDTTEQKNLELQFAQSQKMQAVGQLAGGVAHDFNNLLTAIIGFSDLLLVRHGPGDQSFSDIIQVKQNANRAANLVRQLLAFSRQQTLRPKVLIITDVLAELSNLLGRLIGDGIELEMKHGRDLGQVKVDQGQMEQVIINLCVNARDAMDNKGRISIRTRNISYAESKRLSERYKVMPRDEYILLEVEDSGCGIAKEHLGKIFEPFFSTKEVGKGTGLGLSTVYGIVKQTGGFIFPTSDAGKGTVFSIYLPVYKDTQKLEIPKEKEVEKITRDLTGKGSILLVEDEEAVRMFASRALKNKGYNVYEANSGAAAIAMFEEIEEELDLVISDVVMPLMDGPTLVRRIREVNQNLKVIFISGYAEDAFDQTPRDEDFHFLSKPFSLKQLAEKVKEVLETN